MVDESSPDYGVAEMRDSKPIPAPDLDYEPRDPSNYRPGIAVIGCGGVSEQHLQAYKNAGYNVVALCDLDEEQARRRRSAFFPDA